MSVEERAKEIAAFLKMPEADALAKLQTGFLPLHEAVTEDFRRASPRNDEELLAWYRSSEAYIWELSAYHEDAGFNYAGMCRGIAEALKSHGCGRVLCLGDGIGDLTLTLCRYGMEGFYHDLAGSRTAAFAMARITGEFPVAAMSASHDFTPPPGTGFFDSVVSLDFLEHVPNVEAWVRAIHAALKPGGYFVAQNAFACGSGSNGAMPMHLAVNDKYEKLWDPLLTEVGFNQIASNWYRKA